MRTHSRFLAAAGAGTATGLLLSEAKREDIMAHPEFQASVASIRKELVRSLKAEELKQHPEFAAVLAQAVEAGVTEKIKALKPEEIKGQEPFKSIIEAEVKATVLNSESAKQFAAMLKEVSGAKPGSQTEEDAAKKPKLVFAQGSSEDGNVLETETRALMAADSKLSYADAQIAAAMKTGYGKPKGGTS
jgi:hypothetical protein